MYLCIYAPFTKEKANFNMEEAQKNTIIFEEGKDDKTGAQLGWQHEQQFIMRERYRDESYVSVTISRVIGFKESTCKGEGTVTMKDQVGSRVIKRTGGLSRRFTQLTSNLNLPGFAFIIMYISKLILAIF